MAIIIEATIVSGLRAATMTVRLQMPLLVINHFPEIRDCRPATINLQLDRPLRVNNPTFTTPPIPWIPNRPELSETFSFLNVRLELNRKGPGYIFLMLPLIDTIFSALKSSQSRWTPFKLIRDASFTLQISIPHPRS